MATLLSKSSQYAIQAVVYVAHAAPQRTLVHVKEISEDLHIPYHFLGKILQTLSRHGILASQKGLKGGFSLARLPEQITLMDIIEAVDGDAFRTECFFGFPGCGESVPCSIHELWSDARAKILDSLRRTTIADLSSEMETKMNIPVPQSSSAHQEKYREYPLPIKP